jgi:ATP-dependent helicase/nuclease subunit B
VAAFYVQLLRDLEKVDHPDDAKSPDDPNFHLRVKPRGVIDAAHRDLVDSQLVGNASEVVQLFINKDGALGRKNYSDGCENAEFSALLRLVERKLGELTDRILGGDISVAPYRISQISPCPNCEYRSVCRFDVAVNSYRPLDSIKREDVLARAIEEADGH